MRKEIWTGTSINEYDQNMKYLLEGWSEKEAVKFNQ
jgi:hypothetical protein